MINTFAIVGLAILLDVITGLVKAYSKGTFETSTMRVGMWHKVSEIFALVLAYFVQYSLPYLNVDYSIPAVSAVSIYIVIMEIGSCIENVGVVNPQLAKPLSKIFAKLKEDGENDASK